jgi:hypothetical protein
MNCRNRAETCPYCRGYRAVDINLGEMLVLRAYLPPNCKYGYSCIQEIRDKALLVPFEDGKTRTR